MKLDPGLALSNMLGIVAVVSCCFNHEKRTFGYFSGSFWSIFILFFCGCQFLDPLVITVFRLLCHAAMEWRAQHSTPGLLAKSGSGPKPALATRTGTGKGGYRCCLYFWINRNDLAPTSLEW
jgi:hypothetical protein